MFEPIDRDGDVEFLGLDVAGVARNFVVRTEPQPPAGLRLEVEVAADVRDVRRVVGDRRIDAELDQRAAKGADPDRRDALKRMALLGAGGRQ